MSQTAMVFEKIMQLVFPPHCLFCDAIIPLGLDECGSCNDTAALRRHGKNRSTHPDKNTGQLDGLVSSFVYSGQVAEAVARYKFSGKRDLYRDMAKYMAEDYIEIFGADSVDAVVHVPGYKEKAEHTRLLASGVARLIGRPFEGDILSKTRGTEKQHSLGAKERKTNITGAFAAKHNKAAGKSILICDDVATSGNTLNECAAALRAAGARQVYGLSFSATY